MNFKILTQLCSCTLAEDDMHVLASSGIRIDEAVGLSPGIVISTQPTKVISSTVYIYIVSVLCAKVFLLTKLCDI